MSKEVPPAHVMGYLNALFTLFDELIDQYEVSARLLQTSSSPFGNTMHENLPA